MFYLKIGPFFKGELAQGTWNSEKNGKQRLVSPPSHPGASVGPLSLGKLERSLRLGSNINLLQIPRRSHKSCAKPEEVEEEEREEKKKVTYYW